MSTLQAIGNDQKRAALDRLLASSTFSRSDQLRRFLKYVCEMEIAGRGQDITEYAIATEALGRSPGYTPGDDSSVRSRAFALRQKLQEFYDGEDPAAPIRIELRKGSYIPVYTEHAETPRAPEPVRPPSLPPPRVPRAWFRPFLAGMAAATVLAVLMAAMFAALNLGSTVDPVLREAWGPMVEPGAPVIICLGSVPSLLLKSFQSGTLPPAPRFLPAPREIADWYSGLHMMDGGGDLFMQTTQNTLLSGDSLAAVRAARLLAATRASVQVLPEYGLRPLALRGRNVLVIGSPNYSPYAGRILAATPFSVRFDPVRKEEVIADGPPEAAGTRVYRPKRNSFGELTQVYGLLTVIPSQTTGDSGEKTVVFSGITSAGPQAAMEFFASPVTLRELKSHMQVDHLPAAYQVVIRCGVDRALALTWAYETFRIIDRPPSFD